MKLNEQRLSAMRACVEHCGACDLVDAEVLQLLDEHAEATALLERWVEDDQGDSWLARTEDTRAFLASRTAAPVPHAPEPSADNRDALLACARSWEPNVRLLGNVRACTIAKVCTDAEAAETKLAAVEEIVSLWHAFTVAQQVEQAYRGMRSLNDILTPAGPNGGAK